MAFRIVCGNARQLEKIPNLRFHTMVGVATSSNRQNLLNQASILPKFSTEDNIGNAVHTVQGVQGDVDIQEAITIARSKYVLARILEKDKLTRSQQRDNVIQGVQENMDNEHHRLPSYTEDDPHIDAMNSGTSVSLHSVMQSNVPDPFNPSIKGNPTHVNMPGGGILRQEKYTYDSVQTCHPSRSFSSLSNSNQMDTPLSADLLSVSNTADLVGIRESHSKGGSESEVSTNSDSSKSQETQVKLSQKDRLKRAVKDYGATVVVFHVSISLMSLGGCYLAVSSDMIDLVGLLSKFQMAQDILQSSLATGATTFAVSYAVHKVFAPVRIAMTLTCTPFIVRYLRRVGFIKPPKL